LKKKSCITADREILENEMLLTKLGGTVGYCEVKLDGELRRLVVLAGFPIGFKTFCQLATIHLSECEAYYSSIEAEVLNLWDELGYQSLNQNAPVEVQCSYDHWQFEPSNKSNVSHLLDLFMRSQGEDTTKTDFLPLMAEIGRRVSDSITRG
jgi:hypothetical protein